MAIISKIRRRAMNAVVNKKHITDLWWLYQSILKCGRPEQRVKWAARSTSLGAPYVIHAVSYVPEQLFLKTLSSIVFNHRRRVDNENWGTSNPLEEFKISSHPQTQLLKGWYQKHLPLN